jgi:hypothetical protein
MNFCESNGAASGWSFLIFLLLQVYFTQVSIALYLFNPIEHNIFFQWPQPHPQMNIIDTFSVLSIGEYNLIY